MLRLRPLAWSGVRSGAQDGTSDVRCGAQDGTSDVRCGAQVQLPAQVQAQLPARLSNSTSSAKSLIEPIAQPPRELRMVAAVAPSAKAFSCQVTKSTLKALASAASMSW